MKPNDTIEVSYDDCRFDVEFYENEIQGVWIGSKEILRFLDSNEVRKLQEVTEALIKENHEPSEPLEDYICS